jgi:hypothetical protein
MNLKCKRLVYCIMYIWYNKKTGCFKSTTRKERLRTPSSLWVEELNSSLSRLIKSHIQKAEYQVWGTKSNRRIPSFTLITFAILLDNIHSCWNSHSYIIFTFYWEDNELRMPHCRCSLSTQDSARQNQTQRKGQRNNKPNHLNDVFFERTFAPSPWDKEEGWI